MVNMGIIKKETMYCPAIGFEVHFLTLGNISQILKSNRQINLSSWDSKHEDGNNLLFFSKDLPVWKCIKNDLSQFSSSLLFSLRSSFSFFFCFFESWILMNG